MLVCSATQVGSRAPASRSEYTNIAFFAFFAFFVFFVVFVFFMFFILFHYLS